jgi:hypothetical protein
MINVGNIRRENLAFLRDRGVDVASVVLPLLDVPKEVRTAEVIANRVSVMHVLHTIYLRGVNSRLNSMKLIKFMDWLEFLSVKERAALKGRRLDKCHMTDFMWKKESMFVLLWCIGVLDREALFRCYDEEMHLGVYYSKIPPIVVFDTFVREAKLLDLEDLFQGVDFYYILHYLASRGVIDSGLLPLLTERRRALEYVINPDLEWDDITLYI